MIITLFSFAAAEERVPVATPTGLNAQTQFFAFFVMKAAELKCPNRIVYRVCRVEHFKTLVIISTLVAKHTQSTLKDINRKAHSKHTIFRRLHTDCLSKSETETEFGFAFAIGAVATLIQRLCLFRVCDNIVDATNLNDYVPEL